MTKNSFQSLTHSLFLFRKVIPGSFDKEEMKKAYLNKMCSPQEPADENFLRFCKKEIKGMFRKGWDNSYRKRAARLIFSTSATVDSPARMGGARGKNENLRHVRRVALGFEEGVCSPVRIEVIPEGVKARLVTVSSEIQFALKPLHDLIYDHLSKNEWLLRGEAKPCSFREFTEREGEVFVSGDYVSATDNLKLDVYQTVLGSILGQGANIPSSVKDYAMRHSVSELYYEGSPCLGTQKRGQLMGNFLSFPILCLINYLAFIYAGGKGYPVRINGDDIVFRAPRWVKERWELSTRIAGLVIHKGKTMIDKQFFSLNSTLFRGTTKVRLVPFIRSKPLFKKAEKPCELAGKYGSLCPGFNGCLRRRLQCFFLRRNSKLIYLSQRSLIRGHGMRVPYSVLSECGLLARERFYLRAPSEEPLLIDPPDKASSPRVEGFQSMVISGLPSEEKKLWRMESKAFGLACRLYAQCPVVFPTFRENLQRGTSPYLKPNLRLLGKLKKWVKYGHWYRDPPPQGRKSDGREKERA
uniref:Putative RdRp n=1 Tax=Podosphaera ourmiavirus B TaxID=2592714 RepID=A0A7G3KFY3_9VIRU|nr:putative RdRp [Podosphaera ourmiavirus B]